MFPSQLLRLAEKKHTAINKQPSTAALVGRETHPSLPHDPPIAPRTGGSRDPPSLSSDPPTTAAKVARVDDALEDTPAVAIATGVIGLPKAQPLPKLAGSSEGAPETDGSVPHLGKQVP